MQLSHERHLGALFFKRVAELGGRSFIKVQRGERFDEISWGEFGNKVRHAIFALYALGLQRGERVAIIGENSVEWLCADLATLSGGFPNVILSPGLSDATLLKILHHSSCRAAFLQNQTAVGRLLNLKGQLAALDQLIVLDGTGSGLPKALVFGEFLARGAYENPERLRAILDSVHPHDLATIMYTSGSTGEPKGVMRTQDNLLANITNGAPVPVSKPDELTVLVLSLNHLFGRFGFLKSAATGRTTAIIEATETAVDLKTIEALAPTALAMVPRVIEKILQRILDEKGWRRKSERLEELDRRRNNDGLGLSGREQAELDSLCVELGEVMRAALGGRIKYIAYGGAAMPPRIIRLFQLVGVPLLGSYGITECGGVTLSGIGETKPGSLGRPFPNVELRIAEDGELLVRGPTVSPGYFENPEATWEAIDSDGWFHTGDFARIDEEGCLFVVGRKKDIFNCANGSNIYPARIELLLDSDPFIRQAILVGDQRPFIAALIVPDRRQIATELKKPETILNDGDIKARIRLDIDEINRSLEAHERIRDFALVDAEFPPEVRSVTVFQKIKVDRRAVEERYKEMINAIYSTASQGGSAWLRWP
jgi:long-chain acyl-CoA synthetase